MAQRTKVPYLKWSRAQRAYLMYLADGVDPERIHAMLPNDDGSLGVSASTVRGWRHRDATFADAIEHILNDAGWFHVHIAVPMQIAGQDRARLEGVLIHGAPMEKLNGKEFGLLLEEKGYIGGEESAATNEAFIGILADMRIERQERVVHELPQPDIIEAA